MSGKSKFFETFLKQNPIIREKQVKSKGQQEFFFALFPSTNGVHLKTVGRNLKPKKIKPEIFSGILRQTIELFNQYKLKSETIVDWDNPNSYIYLDKFPDLLEHLMLTDNLIDYKGRKIYTGNRTYPVTVNITNDDLAIRCSVTVAQSSVDSVVSDQYVIIGNRLLHTESIGSNYGSLIDLDTSIVPLDLPLYLTILYSNFTNIELNYQDFTVIHQEEFELTPSLLIESIDSSGFMVMKGSFSYKNIISPEFYSKYYPSKAAVIDNSSRMIVVSDLIQPEIDTLDRFLRILIFLEEKYELSDSFNIEADGVLINPKLANVIMNSEIKEILENFTIFGDKFLKQNHFKRSHSNLELLLSTSIDYLQGSAYLNVDGEKVKLFEAIKQFDEKGYVQLKDNVKGLLDRHYIDRVKKVIKEGVDGVELSFFDIPYIQEELDGKIKGDEFIEKVKRFSSDMDQLKEITVDCSKLNGTLRPYQVEGVKWMMNLHHIGVSGCLADDMGLGKTVQTITFLLQILKNDSSEPILIVLPKSLIFNWIKELEKFAPQLNYYPYYGINRNIDKIKESTIILTTYHTLRNDIEKLKEIQFSYAILDEIQNIKNHSSKITKATYLIKSRRRLGISGTPVENSLGDLYSISRFLNPTLFGSFKRFKDEWSGPIVEEESEIVSTILRRKIQPLFLRRIKENVLEDLPPKSEQVIYVDMSPKQSLLYEKVRKDYYDKIHLKIKDEGIDKNQLMIIKAFMELRQIATVPEVKSSGTISSTKREQLLEHLIETVAGGHKVLVFSNFLSAIDSLAHDLKEEDIDYRVITGATNKREQVVEEFQDDPNVKVLIMTLKTGGVGLNLTAASYVYIMDPWWNLASENQAIDRTHRIGQLNPVFCYRFISRGTIEEKILELHSKKKALFDNLFTNKKGDISSFDTQDIEHLLG